MYTERKIFPFSQNDLIVFSVPIVSLKNAAEMLEFSCLYNAGNLKCVCLEFVCMNISCLFEAG